MGFMNFANELQMTQRVLFHVQSELVGTISVVNVLHLDPICFIEEKDCVTQLFINNIQIRCQDSDSNNKFFKRRKMTEFLLPTN